MIDFGMRNLTLFFKDRSAVAMSFLAELLIIMLYVLFMRENLISSFSGVQQIEVMMDVWMAAGALGITPVTTAMGAYGVMVDDKVKKIDRDFVLWPIGSWQLMGGYFFSAVVIGILMSFLFLLLCEGYLFFRYGLWMGAENMLHIYGILAVNAAANAAVALLLASFIKTSNALAACCTIIGALLGFLTGIYLPVGSLPEGVQWMVKSFPVSHGVILLRQALMEDLVSQNLGGANSPQAHTFMAYMGVRFELEGRFLTESASLAYLTAFAVLCLILTGLRFSMKRRRP